MVGLLLAVGIATLLAIILSAGYALVLRELRQINANLEQLIELGAAAAAMTNLCARITTQRYWVEYTRYS